MTQISRCPDCGTAVSDEAPDGLCPKCLLRVALDSPEEESNQIAAGATSVSQTNSNRKSASDVIRQFGDYELLAELARGGMGVVYKARQRKLDRLVALKMILSGHLASDHEIDRFHREAQAAARLDHPGIVPIYEVGQQDGQHFFSMAYVAGESLAARLEREPIAPREAARLLKQIAEGVQCAHEQGVIHRDLKPANILLDESGTPRITDFGLARRTDDDVHLTMTGQTLGTPGFMPPEQASGKATAIGPTADVYSLGAILYAMLTGQAPFQADTLLDTLNQICDQEPASPRNLNEAVPRDLETICLKCLEKDPTTRYASASELISDLTCFLDEQPINSRPDSIIGRALRWRRIVKRNKDVRIRSATRILGIPLVDIAFGHDDDAGETRGHARGIFAFGDVATGLVAFGVVARGLVAIGQHAFGMFTFGTTAVGVLSMGVLSLGAVAGGMIAAGGGAFGLVAIGYGAVGMFSFGKHALGGFIWKL